MNPGPTPPPPWRNWSSNLPTAPGSPPTRTTPVSRRGTPPTAPSAPTPAASAPASTRSVAASRRRAPCRVSTRPSTPTTPSPSATACPCGAFDLDHVTGNVDIRHADGTETFTPLGEPDTTENPKPGEIIYADTTGVLTRHWNHRDAHRTRVTEDSTHVTFVLETLHATRDGDLLKVAAEELQGLLIPHAEQTAVHYLSPAHHQATA